MFYEVAKHFSSLSANVNQSPSQLQLCRCPSHRDMV